MRENEKEYQELFAELSGYEQKGYMMELDGLLASPMQIVAAHMAKEDNSYMRDYIFDEKGSIEALCFNHIKEAEIEQQYPSECRL